MRSDRPTTTRRARPDFGQSPYVAPRYQSRVWGRVIFAGLMIALLGGVAIVGGLYWSLHRAQGAGTSSVTFHVGAGDGVTSIANRLSSDGLIDSTLLFRLDARLQNLGGKLKVGDFILRRNMSIDEMVAALQVLHTFYLRVTIPEGMRMEQIAAILDRKGISGQSFLREARHPNLSPATYPILRDRPKSSSLEGYLFPNTYVVPQHESGRDFAVFMVSTLNSKFTLAMRGLAARHHLSIFHVLTLASIVEREARAPGERPIIAAVYLNRLSQNIGLFADPTVQYAVGKPRNWWPVLHIDPHTVVSTYNTYTHLGLPPGPIANPGLASIVAVIGPAHTNYLYFVAIGNGRHAFESTLEQHNLDVCKYQPPCTP